MSVLDQAVRHTEESSESENKKRHETTEKEPNILKKLPIFINNKSTEIFIYRSPKLGTPKIIENYPKLP